MARTKNTEQPEEIQQLQEQLRLKKLEHKRKSLVENARHTLENLEGEYEHSKEVFFAVNGARRILKNA